MHRNALLEVTSLSDILLVLGLDRAEDGLPPNWLELLPTNPTTPKSSLRVDRSRCMQEIFRKVYDEQVAPSALTGEEEPDMIADSKKHTPRPGVVCIVASSGSGKTFWLQRMAAAGIDCLSTVAAAGADLAFLDWLSRVVIVAVNFNSHFQISLMEAYLVKDGLLSFEDLVRLRLVYSERADLGNCDQKEFVDYITCIDFAVRKGMLSSRLMSQASQLLLRRRAGRGAPSDPLILFVDEVAKIGNTMDSPIQVLREYLSANVKRFADPDGVLPSVVALLVSACCHVADAGSGSVLSSSTESRLVQEGATVISGRRAPHYDGLVNNPEDCIPLCLAALTQLARRGKYIYSREIDSTELAFVLRGDFGGGGRTLSSRAIELLTPVARSLAFAVGGHLRTAVQLYLSIVSAGVKQDVGVMLDDIVTDGFDRVASDLWDTSSEEDRNAFVAAMILGKKVDYTDTAFSTVVAGRGPTKWDNVRRRGLVYGSGSPFCPRMSPIMLRRLLKRPTSEKLLFKASLSSHVGTSTAPSWMEWESFCCCREWAHSIARSLEPSSFSAVGLGDLFGIRSTYCGKGDLLTRTLVDASVARVGVDCRNLQTLLSWEGTSQENGLMGHVWLLTEMTAGIDAIMFFRCTSSIQPELVNELIAVGMEYKFKNLYTEDAKQKLNLLSPSVVYDKWKSLATEKSFGSYWADWKERFVFWGITYMDAQSSFDMKTLAPTSPACAGASIVTTKADLVHVFDATTFHNSMAPGVLLKCKVQAF